MLQQRSITGTCITVSPVGIGTWVMGGWMWNGANEQDAHEALVHAFEHGVNLIDTAPIYGFGKAEEIVGNALSKYGHRDRIIIATKFGLEWDTKHRIRKNNSRKHIIQEIDESLRRLKTDYIDLYQVHWHDDNTSLIETMSTLSRLKKQGKIRAIGVCNFDIPRIQKCLKQLPLNTVQIPFNLLEQENKESIMPYCIENDLSTLTYGTLCKGLLTGKFNQHTQFERDDVRYTYPAFSNKLFPTNLHMVNKLKKYAAEKNYSLTQLIIEWTINQPGITCALVGTRNRAQAEQNFHALNNYSLSAKDISAIDTIIADSQTGRDQSKI